MGDAAIPRVSVCIPTADRPAFLREAVESAVAQTYRHIELVVSDNSREVSNREKNRRILAEVSTVPVDYRVQPTPVDAITNFNTLIDLARGQLWTVLGDDDRLRPTAVQRAVEALDAHPECGFTFADHFLMRADGTIDAAATERNSIHFGRNQLREGVYTHDTLFDLALAQSMCLQTMTFRREVISAFRFVPDIVMGDFSLALRIASGDRPVHAYYLPDRVFDYRIHAGQVTTVMDRRSLISSSIDALLTVSAVPDRVRRRYRRKLARQLTALAVAESEVGERGSARAHALKALVTMPSPTALAGLVAVQAPRLLRLVRFVQSLRSS
jgi:glycosyltransferase involved in cell wall biosynthesis